MGGEGFCEGTDFWDYNLLKNNSWPEFTPCFQTSVLTLIPCLWLWSTLSFFLRYLYHIHLNYSLSRLCIAKLVLCVVLVLISVCNIATRHFLPTVISRSPAFYTSTAIRLVPLGLALWLTVVSRRKGLYSPCLLFIYWFLWLLADIIPFYTLAVLWNERRTSELAVFYIQYGVLLVQFILSCFSDRDQITSTTGVNEKMMPCPEINASFPNKVTFNWMQSMMWTGWRRTLLEEDMWELPPHIKCKEVFGRFYRNWNKYFNRTHINSTQEKGSPKPPEKQTLLEMQPVTTVGKNQSENDVLSDLIANTSSDHEDNKKGKTLTLIKSLLMTYYGELLKAHAYKLVTLLLRFLNPILLKLMIEFIQNKQDDIMWQGYWLAVCMFLTAVTSSLLEAQCFNMTVITAVKSRTGLVAAVYKKSLTMNNEFRKHFTTGAIVNHMSIDCNRIEGCVHQLHNLWSAPLSMILSFYFLYQTLGVAMVAGIVVMVIVAPFNWKLMFYMKRLHNKQLSIKDERLKNMNEILNGIKVLKLYAWETSFRDKIMAIRNREITIIKRLAIVNAFRRTNISHPGEFCDVHVHV